MELDFQLATSSPVTMKVSLLSKHYRKSLTDAKLFPGMVHVPLIAIALCDVNNWFAYDPHFVQFLIANVDRDIRLLLSLHLIQIQIVQFTDV